MENMTNKQRSFITNEIATPLKTLAALLDNQKVNKGTVRDIISHLTMRVRDLQNGKFEK